jgi:hypothetical protein
VANIQANEWSDGGPDKLAGGEHGECARSMVSLRSVARGVDALDEGDYSGRVAGLRSPWRPRGLMPATAGRRREEEHAELARESGPLARPRAATPVTSSSSMIAYLLPPPSRFAASLKSHRTV